jgi:hypothetical protein
MVLLLVTDGFVSLRFITFITLEFYGDFILL